jgi:hypothetical protein
MHVVFTYYFENIEILMFYNKYKLPMTQLEYQRFPKDIFRKHTHQEVRSLTETPYWLVTKMKKQEQKDKKKAQKLREAEVARLENTNL